MQGACARIHTRNPKPENTKKKKKHTESKKSNNLACFKHKHYINLN